MSTVVFILVGLACAIFVAQHVGTLIKILACGLVTVLLGLFGVFLFLGPVVLLLLLLWH